jgi:hypothetical protein
MHLHTITVSIYGSVTVTESVEVEDAEALPLFIRLKAILGSEETHKPLRRRGRPRKERPAGDDTGQALLPEAGEAADPTEA